MNSMVAAYHRTRGSVSGESNLENKLSKKRKSTSGKGEPSSPTGENPAGGLVKSSIEVVDETVESEQNVDVIKSEKSFSEATAGANQKTSGEEVETLSEIKNSVETSGKIVVHTGKSETEESKKSSNDQKQAAFFIPRMSVDVSGTEPPDQSLLELVLESTEEPGFVVVDFKTKLEKNGGVSAPFSKFVDLSRLSVALSAERVTMGQEGISEDLLKQYLQKKDKKLLKMSIRQNRWGASHEIREVLWPLLCKHFHKAHEDDMYEEFAVDMFGQGSLEGGIVLPSFVDFTHLECFNLSTEGLVHAKKITSVIEHTNPDITYCPLLFPLVSVLLHYTDPSTTYNCIYSLLRRKEDEYISQTKVSYEAAKFVIRDLAKKYARSCYSHLVRSCNDFDTVFDAWIWWIISDLPFPYLVQVIDCFISEGMKVFYRVMLAILIIYAKYHAKKSSKPVTNIVSHIQKFCRELPVTVEKLLKVAFSIKGLSRKEIKKLHLKHSMYIKSVTKAHIHDDQNGGGLQVSMSRSFSGPIILQSLHSSVLTPDMLHEESRSKSRSVSMLQVPLIENSLILNRTLLYSIWTWLPTRYAVCQPLLLYTSEEHGTSLVTLYSRVENYQPTIIVIKNTENEIFGAFCSSYWRERKMNAKNLSYFGTGETFVFTLSPEKKKYDWIGLKEESIPNTANMFQAGDRTVLTVGGGHGGALILDETLSHCRTEKCDTFGNQPLCGHEDFSCNVVEVYGFQ